MCIKHNINIKARKANPRIVSYRLWKERAGDPKLEQNVCIYIYIIYIYIHFKIGIQNMYTSKLEGESAGPTARARGSRPPRTSRPYAQSPY